MRAFSFSLTSHALDVYQTIETLGTKTGRATTSFFKVDRLPPLWKNSLGLFLPIGLATIK